MSLLFSSGADASQSFLTGGETQASSLFGELALDWTPQEALERGSLTAAVFTAESDVSGIAHHSADTSSPLGKDLNIPRSFRWQVLQSQWQRDFAPEYQLLFEPAMPSSPELEPGRIEPKPPQVQWVLGPQTGGSLRPGGWKDTNLQFRFIQQADFSLA
ncbi:hypothetical protein [Shewanella sp.]|uniref:hypothetical protein n=1 Tax=Shewanella sp. TaxID=50422 RepID=UPI003569EB48